MDYIPMYKRSKKQRANLMVPPPYCRSADRRLEEKYPSLKLDVSDPGKLLLFVESLTDPTSKGLEKKINKYVQKETQSDLAFMISVTNKEACIQVIGTKKLELVKRCKMPEDVVDKIYNQCTTPGFKMMFGELPSEFQSLLTEAVEHNSEVVSFPIITPSHPNMKLLLVCLFNSKQDNTYLMQFMQETFRFCLPILMNTSTSEHEAKTTQECQTLLLVARKLFAHLDDLTDLLREIMSEARNLTDAERCSLFLVEEDTLIAKVFDGTTTDGEREVRIPSSMGIVGHVATTGKILNIKNAYSHPLFYKTIDELTGFKTRNILTFPIRDEEGIIGVAQLCNKKEGDFTADDEESAMAFSIYCGLSIMHSLIYKRTQEAQIKTQLCNELMMYHMKVDEREVTRVLHCRNAHAVPMDGLNFAPRSIVFIETPCYIVKIFENLKLIDTFNIKRDLLLRFILHIKKGYRDTPYHNWMHAFSFTHFSYLVVKEFSLIEKNIITHLEALALIIASLGHDIDHRGTTNSFQLKTGSPLANLYSSEGSVMERHHLSQTLCILNTEKCNFLECLDNQSYRRVLDVIKTCIIATDLSVHFHKLSKMKHMAESGYNRENLEHKNLLLSLIMTCADLSDQTKGWLAAKQVAQMVYAEFFVQGDLEKKMGGKPLEMMDREKASIPDLQIEFLNDVCLPAYRCLANLFPRAEVFVDTLWSSVQYWEASKAVFERHTLEGRTSLEVLMSSGLEDEVTEELKDRPEIIEAENSEDTLSKMTLTNIIEAQPSTSIESSIVSAPELMSRETIEDIVEAMTMREDEI